MCPVCVPACLAVHPPTLPLPPAPAAVNCKADIKQLCSGVDASEEGAVLDCLRKQRRKLRGRCKASRRTAPPRAASCAAGLPPQTETPKTPATKCLGWMPHHTLTHTCPHAPIAPAPLVLCTLQKYVFELEREASDNFRLDAKLFRACALDKSRLCPDAAPHGGESRYSP